MNHLISLLLAAGLLIAAGCVHPRIYSPTTGRIRTVQLANTPAQIERGRYLANHVAVCMDCHSRRDYSRLGGPLEPRTLGGGGQEFGKNYGLPGVYYASNITPFALKNWTDTELLLAITAGVTRTHRPLFPLMPYLNYGKMDEQDAIALVAYLRTLEPIENPVPPSRPTAPVKLAMKLMSHKARFKPMPDADSPVAYGRYLVTMAGCADCHTRRTMGGLIKKTAFAGGTAIDLAGGTLRSANITPDPEMGIGAWNKADFIRRFKTYDPLSFKPPLVGQGFNTVMPWSLYAGMTETDLGAIYDYLRTLKPVHKPVKTFTAKNAFRAAPAQ